MIGYDESNVTQQVAVFNTTPNGSDGGIWMSGAAPAADSTGNIYLANGTFNGTDKVGDSILKFGAPSSHTQPLRDFFTPTNQASLNGNDTDLGSGGVRILPDLASGIHPHLLVQVGKQGAIYVINRNIEFRFSTMTWGLQPPPRDRIMPQKKSRSESRVLCQGFHTSRRLSTLHRSRMVWRVKQLPAVWDCMIDRAQRPALRCHSTGFAYFKFIFRTPMT